MARLGVTYAEIAAAARALKTAGHEPTVDRVREHLGTGSRSTIGPLLKKWRTEKQASEDLELPADLLEAMKALSERVRKSADQQVEQMRVDYEATIATAHERVTQQTEATLVLAAEKEALTAELSARNEEISALKTTLEQVRLSAAKVEVSRDQATAEIAELKARLAEQKHEIRSIRQQSEHYQQSVAEDRQQERGEHLLQIQQYQSQIKKLLDQTATVEHRYGELKLTNEQLRHELDNQVKSNRDLNDRHYRLKGDMESIMLRMKELIHERDRLQIRLDTASNQASQSANALSSSMETARRLAQSLEKAEQRLEYVERSLAQLNKANERLNQEKTLVEERLLRLRKKHEASTDREQPNSSTDSGAC